MFLNFYGLAEQPFGVTPNTRYLYLTPTHREAMASIFYGVIENRGFTALIAPPGMGKSTLLFELLQRCGSLKTLFLFQFQNSPEGLLRNLLAELGIDGPRDFTEMQQALNQAILREAAEGKPLVVVMDEAQNLAEPVLEVLRMLSNFETSSQKLVHVILAGQPQLAEKLLAPSLAQLRQRISVVAGLSPLDSAQTHAYIVHRLRVAGYASSEPIFNEAASDLIAHYAGGIPRNINNICFNAMSLGCSLKRKTIDREIVDEVYQDLDFGRLLPQPVISEVPQKPASSSISNNHTSEPRSAGRGLVRTAIAASLVSVLCLVGVVVNHRLNRPSDVGANTADSAPVATRVDGVHSFDSSNPGGAADQKLSIETAMEPSTESPAQDGPPSFRSVQVLRGQTLYTLCMENLGEYNEKVDKEIRSLNPWLRNPKRVRLGQVIRIPMSNRPSEKTVAVKSRTLAVANSGERQ
jgi:type II secretory pathway predicted ATPase ExeA